jgi:hypothetical protein
MTTAEVEASEDGITVQLPLTAGSWNIPVTHDHEWVVNPDDVYVCSAPECDAEYDVYADTVEAQTQAMSANAMREVPVPVRGAGPVECRDAGGITPTACHGHRARCLFGGTHVWATWYENGILQRTWGTLYCHVCGGVCTAEEEGA